MTEQSIECGTHVQWDGKTGQVDLVVSSGAVPGVEGEVQGTTDAPVARVIVGEEKVAVPVADLTATDPPVEYNSSTEALIGLLAKHARESEGKGAEAALTPEAMKTAYERGLHAWPGADVTTLTPDEWAVGRVGLLAKAAVAPEAVADTGFADGDLLDPDNAAATDPTATGADAQTVTSSVTGSEADTATPTSKPAQPKPTQPVLDFTGQDPEDPDGDYPAQPGDPAADPGGDEGPDGSPDASAEGTTVSKDQLNEMLADLDKVASTDGDSTDET